MIRKTVTFNKEIFKKLQGLRGSFLSKGMFEELSFTTMVNLVLLSGLVFSDRATEEDWKMLRSFLSQEGMSLDNKAEIDRLYDRLLKEKLKAAKKEKAKEEPKYEVGDEHRKAYV